MSGALVLLRRRSDGSDRVRQLFFIYSEETCRTNAILTLKLGRLCGVQVSYTVAILKQFELFACFVVFSSASWRGRSSSPHAWAGTAGMGAAKQFVSSELR
jgi:hypothetical protein